MKNEDLSKFIKEKLDQGYNPADIKNFLVKQNINNNLIDNIIKSYTKGSKEQTSKNLKYKLLILIVIPLILTSITLFFLSGIKNGPELLSFETKQNVSTSLEEECFKILSDLIKLHFDTSVELSYRDFLNTANIYSNSRNFFNIEYENQTAVSFWRIYTFGTQTSLNVTGVPFQVKNYFLHLDYDFNHDFVGCVASQITPAGKYDFMSLNSTNSRQEPKEVSYDFQTIKTDLGNFDLRLYKKLYFDNEGNDMFYSSLISLLPEESKKLFLEGETYSFRSILLRQKIRRLIFVSLLLLGYVGVLYILNKFYLKLF